MKTTVHCVSRYCDFDDIPFYKVVVTYDNYTKDIYYFNSHSNNNHLLWLISSLLNPYKVVTSISVKLTKNK